jgi:hypothetical protein
MTTIARLPFSLMLAIIVALVLVIDVVGVLAHWGDRTLYLLVIPAGLAAWFLVEYRKLPYAVPDSSLHPSSSSSAPGFGTGNRKGEAESSPDFEDPVEEADRIESEARREQSEETAATEPVRDEDELP